MLPKFLAWTAFALAMLFAMLSSVGILAGGLLGTSTATAMVFSGSIAWNRNRFGNHRHGTCGVRLVSLSLQPTPPTADSSIERFEIGCCRLLPLCWHALYCSFAFALSFSLIGKDSFGASNPYLRRIASKQDRINRHSLWLGGSGPRSQGSALS